MAIEHVNPYWHDEDYKPKEHTKKKVYGGKQKRRLTKEEKKQKEELDNKKRSFPWEI